ncbi:MAG: pseudouridine synthase [Cyanobacteriota bacterium]|nr:pseudouridine synthase [Cyanobacteriota bacterium]
MLLPADWLPAALNDGWAYRDRVTASDLSLADLSPAAEVPGPTISAYYAARYAHSDRQVWGQRIAAGQIWRNGQQLWGDVALAAGDRLVWHRPPWQEAAVPLLPGPLFDDGDLVVFNKPSGLPVLPAGGFLRHTVLGQLEAQVQAGELDAASGIPRPVHRLGRFTSGLLVCARTSPTRAWLSARLRESTDQVSPCAEANAAFALPAFGASTLDRDPHARSPKGLKKRARTLACFLSGTHKLYRALLTVPFSGSPFLRLKPGESCTIDTPIARCPHDELGAIWCAAGANLAAKAGALAPLPACSRFTLLEARDAGWLFAVAIATGRPHQIRIHAAAAGAPLLGDPLYWPGGQARSGALPGDGGYLLHAHRVRLKTPQGEQLDLQAPLPQILQEQGKAIADANSQRKPLRGC